jgi:hypothetical protein
MGPFRKKSKRDEIFDLADCAFKLYQSGSLQASADLYARCLRLRDRHAIQEKVESDLLRFYHVCHYLGRKKEALALFARYKELTPPRSSNSEKSAADGYPLLLDERGSKL